MNLTDPLSPDSLPTDPAPTVLDDVQRARIFALTVARPLLTGQGLASRTPPAVDDLIRLAQWLIDGEVTDLYPFLSGDVTVLGPEIFSANDTSVISWKGRNYVPEEDEDGHDDD